MKHVVIGHKAADYAETVIINLLRDNLPCLSRGTNIVTDDESSDVKQSKPLKYLYEKEIVLYAYHKKLGYFTAECIYSPEAFRGSTRCFIKSFEKVWPSAIVDLVRSGENMARTMPRNTSGSCLC